jgi:hypothetical protein
LDVELAQKIIDDTGMDVLEQPDKYGNKNINIIFNWKPLEE